MTEKTRETTFSRAPCVESVLLRSVRGSNVLFMEHDQSGDVFCWAPVRHVHADYPPGRRVHFIRMLNYGTQCERVRTHSSAGPRVCFLYVHSIHTHKFASIVAAGRTWANAFEIAANLSSNKWAECSECERMAVKSFEFDMISGVGTNEHIHTGSLKIERTEINWDRSNKLQLLIWFTYR